MYRVISIGLGGILIALGITWFFTSLLDDAAIRLAGATEGAVSPMSKLSLGDNLSLMFAGLSITGAGLVAVSVVDSLETGHRQEDAVKK